MFVTDVKSSQLMSIYDRCCYYTEHWSHVFDWFRNQRPGTTFNSHALYLIYITRLFFRAHHANFTVTDPYIYILRPIGGNPKCWSTTSIYCYFGRSRPIVWIGGRWCFLAGKVNEGLEERKHMHAAYRLYIPTSLVNVSPADCLYNQGSAPIPKLIISNMGLPLLLFIYLLTYVQLHYDWTFINSNVFNHSMTFNALCVRSLSTGLKSKVGSCSIYGRRPDTDFMFVHKIPSVHQICTKDAG